MDRDYEILSKQQRVSQFFSKSRVFRFLEKDPIAKLAIVTAILTACSFLFKIGSYVSLNGYLSVFSISVNKVDISSDAHALTYLLDGARGLCFVTLTLYWYHLIDWLVKRKDIHLLLRAVSGLGFLFFIPLLNIPLGVHHYSQSNMLISLLVEQTFMAVAASAMELLVATCCYIAISREAGKGMRAKNKGVHAKSVDTPTFMNRSLFVAVSLLVVTVIFVLYSYGYGEAKRRSEFPLIDGEYAVIYQSRDTYWTVAATVSVDGRKLSLDTNQQRIIAAEGVDVVVSKYDEVTIIH